MECMAGPESVGTTTDAANNRKRTAPSMTTYKIVRFRFNEDSETVTRGLTLEQAQAHGQREDTHGEGWFDGYTEDDGR